MADSAHCLRFDHDEARGGFVLTSTLGPDHGALFLNYGEVMHALLRVKEGYFDNVLQVSQREGLKFGPTEVTPETAEYARRDYLPVTGAPTTA